MSIRNVQVKDKLAVTNVAEICAPLVRASVVGTYEYLARCFQNTFFVYEDNDEIVGYIVGFPNTNVPGEFWLYQVAVIGSQRGKKIGSQLFERFMNQVKAEGYEKIRSHYIFGNERSAKIHEKYGFKACGEDERGPFVESKLK